MTHAEERRLSLLPPLLAYYFRAWSCLAEYCQPETRDKLYQVNDQAAF